MLEKNMTTFVTYKRAEGCAQRTIRDYERVLSHFIAWCKQKKIVRLEECDRSHIREYIADLRDKWSDGTVGIYIRHLRAFLRWMHLEGVVDSNLALAIKQPRRVIREEFPPTLEELELLLSICTDDGWALRDRAIILLMATTGIRRGEFCQLNRHSIAIEDNVGWFKVYSGKGHQYRYAFLTDEATEALLEYLNSRDDDSDALFLSNRGKTLGYDGIYFLIRRRAEQAGLEAARFHPHIFRKFFATAWIENGGDEYRLMKTGGWSDHSLLEVYVRLARRRDLQKAHQKYAPRLNIAPKED